MKIKQKNVLYPIRTNMNEFINFCYDIMLYETIFFDKDFVEK